MAVNFRDCILGKIKDQAISKARGDDVLKRYDDLTAKFAAAGKTEEAAALAAEDFLRGEAKQIEQRQRSLRQHALKQKELSDFLSNTPGEMEKKVADVYQRAAFRQDGIRKQVYGFMDTIAKTIEANFFDTGRDYKTFADGVRAAIDGTASSKEAGQVAHVIKQTFDYLHSRYQAAGGVIGKIENYFPQVHRKEAIRKVSKEEWVNFTRGLLDRENMLDESSGLPFTTQRITQILEKEYDSIVSAGRSDLAKLSKKGEALAGAGGDMDMRRAKSRFLHFRDAAAFMEYNNKFGTGEDGLIQAFLGSVDSMTRDIGTMELLGPKPHAMSRFLDFKMKAEGSSPLKRKWTNAQYRILTSRFESGDVDAVWWKVLTGAQNWLRSSMLGSASISAVSDTAYIMATAKINGLSATGAMKKYFQSLAPGDREAKQIARRSGFIVEAINGAVLADTRFAGEEMNGKVTKWLAGMTNKLSGLGAMTRATQDSISLEGMATIAEQLAGKTAWHELNEDLRHSLSKFGLTKEDWADLGKTRLMETGEAKFLVTSDLRADPKLEAGRAKDIADKLDDWIMSMRQLAANETTLSTRAITTGALFGDGAPGTVSRALASSLFMFKSFPITGITSHLLPAIERARVQRKFDHLAMVMLGTTILGGVAIQMKEFIKGKTGRPAFDENGVLSYKFVMASLLQGGGLGLFGDFFLGDYSRFDRTPLTEAMGPAVGLFEDLYQATKGNLDKYANGEDPNPVRDLFRVAKRNIPLGSLWYSRLAMERLVLDNLERLVDPAFDRRMRKFERQLTQKSGQRFWWSPGESKPDPSLIGGN